MAAQLPGLAQALDGLQMSLALQEGVSKITNGLLIMAVYVVVLAIVALVVGRKFGGKDRRQQKRTANLVWALGLVLFAVVAIPRIFL